MAPWQTQKSSRKFLKKRKFNPEREEEEDDEQNSEPSKQELLASISMNTLRHFFQHREKPVLMPHFKALEREVLHALHEKKTQTTIDAMFTIMDGSPKPKPQMNGSHQ